MRSGSLCALLVITHGATRPVQEHTVLVGMVGADTVAVDRYLRDETKLEGVLFVREPQPHTMHYKAMFAPEGRFALMELTWRDVDGNDVQSARITFGVDSIRSELKDTSVHSFSAPTSLDAIPLPPRPWAMHAYSLVEHAAIIITMSEMRGEGKMPWIMAGETEAVTRRTRRLGADTFEIDYVGGPVRVQVDEGGRVVWLYGELDSVTIVVRRGESDVDLAGLAASFASRDTLKSLPRQSCSRRPSAAC
jgi:hypothetical protein